MPVGVGTGPVSPIKMSSVCCNEASNNCPGVHRKSVPACVRLVAEGSAVKLTLKESPLWWGQGSTGGEKLAKLRCEKA